MKSILAIVVAACGLAVLADSTVAIPGIGEATVTCAEADGWKFDVRAEEKADGTAELAISLSPVDATPRVPPKFDVSFSVPQIDAWHRWSMESERVTMPPDWRSALEPRLCFGFPLVAFIGGDDRNRLAVAVSESKRRVRIDAGLREENAHLTWKIAFFAEPEAPISAYEVKIRFDRRDVFFGDAVSEGMEWIVREGGISPAPVPEAAFDPLYSSWYSFHQDLFDRDVEAECARAAKMGLKVVIVDDGWQTEDTNRGYAFCGDWEVSKRRFPDMAAHVARVHALGMKYMVWYSVPFVGEESRNFARFKGKYLYHNKSKRAGILDPRFPEVRAFLADLYAKALREWDIDGLKLDFIDNFRFDGKDPAVKENYAGRDIQSLPEAVDRLMKEIHAAVTAVKPDALIEFRQQYVGPGMRQYGNMFRACDCPGDATANRCRIANLRLTSGATAVHADMLMWNAADAPESAARFVLSSIFGVVQYSMMLRTLPESHRKMMAHWIDFSQKHRDALLKGKFRPRRFSQMYPLIEAENAAERIVAVYGSGTVAELGAADRDIYLLDATTGEDVVVDFGGDSAQAEAFDTFGTSAGMIQLKHGVQRVKIPKCGYLRIGKEQNHQTDRGAENARKEESFKAALAMTEAKTWESPKGGTLPYRLHVPAKPMPRRLYPMVLLMHGAGSRGTNCLDQIRNGGADFIAWAKRHGEEFVFIAPQCPAGEKWVDSPWNAEKSTMKESPTPYLRMAMEIVDNAMKSYQVDPDRVYVMGISMGGYATWELLQRNPGLFAAALPCCGGGDSSLASRLVDIPIWAFHGDRDDSVPVVRSRSMVEAIKAAGGTKIKYREYPGMAHNVWTPTFSDDSVFEWLFRQRKAVSNR